MTAFLLDPWRDPIMVRAFLEVALLAVAGGVLGSWVVVYGLSYGAESPAHDLLPGLVLAALLGAPLLLGAAAGLLAAAAGVGAAARAAGVSRDTGVAVAVTALFGLGVLLALSASSPPGLRGLLFGDVLGLTSADLVLAGALVAVLAGALAVLHPRLLAVGFDRGAAAALGVPPLLADAALLGALALAILVCVQGLGNLLAVALLVGPAATARLLARRMASMIGLAVALGMAAGVAGLYVSYHLETVAGASVAGVVVVLYAAVAVVSTVKRRERSGTPGLG
jgi:ABC-type Mn2+/Zn2+ transport system permease subunit